MFTRTNVWFFFLALSLWCDFATSKRIQFSSITSIVDLPVQYNTEPVSEQSIDMYVEGLRLVVVTRHGYEFTGTRSEIHKVLEREKQEKLQDIIEGLTQELDFDIYKRSVVGRDQRVKQNPKEYPYTAMGRIEIGCTGSFIASNVVQTAGHCVHHQGKWFRYLDIHREKDCNPDKGIKHKWTHAITLKKWTENDYPNYDIGWIIYESSSPVTMPFTSATPEVNTPIFIYGYPGDKTKACLYGSTCHLSKNLAERLAYRCDTYGGESGSAIYYMKENKPVIIGVHGYGTQDHRTGYNKGTRLTSTYAAIAKHVIAKFN
jgi:V8-like Glu-specific endopeptidase